MDCICCSMPDNLRDFMLAMAVVQDYQLQLAVGAERKEREVNYQFTFRMNDQFRFFEPSIRVLKNNVPIFDYSGWPEKQRSEYGCFVDFDFERAKRIACKVGMHITGGFNAIIGSGAGQWPIMKYILQDLKTNLEMETDILLMPWDQHESEQFNDYLGLNFPELSVISDPRNFKEFEKTPEALLTYINHFKVVIGRAGAVTYAAACLKKTVIEIFPTWEEALLYGNIGLTSYGYIVEDQPITANAMWMVWEDVCHALSLGTKNVDEQALTGSPASIVKLVEGK